MNTERVVWNRILRDGLLSVVLYALPVVLMLAAFVLGGHHLPETASLQPVPAVPAASSLAARLLHHYWVPLFVLALGFVEFSLGLYDARWTKTERYIDVVSFAAPYILISPAMAYLSLRVSPLIFPGLRDRFAWVPFFWALLTICVADDLTQYWYHRLHHQIPWLWRFHRTHHSASYMGMAMANRQNFLYSIFFSQTYVTAVLVYAGLGRPAVVALAAKSIITTLAHSSIPWDKPLYKYRALHPLAWALERFISTPATHHAHHADTSGDGVGYYKGNFGNMFFLWDVIFGTAHISRQYPKSYGVSHYQGDPWYAQFLWPIFKSDVEGSELSPGGPVVK